MTGLYFYKLVTDDAAKLGNVTKDCKLTINEIDHNFATLQNADISNVYVDEEKKHLVLTRNDGNTFVMDVTKITEKPEFDASFDDMDGVLELTYDNNTYVFTDFITKKNLSKEILTKVYSDGTLRGFGTAVAPLRLASVQKTGCYKPVIKYLDTTVNERLPFHHVAKGDRYVTREKVSDYGLLYNFHDAEHINNLLENSGWRIPTKADWDAMLNAMEPCGFKNHESLLSNALLGKVAGSMLKSIDGWEKFHDHDVDHTHTCDKFQDEEFDVEDESNKYFCHPCEKPMSPRGRDAFGMTILPAGYAYSTSPTSFNCFGHKTAFWTADKTDTTNVYTKVFEAKYGGVYQVAEGQDTMLSIRLVKDYDGTNHNEIENILGQNYKTVLLKSENNPNGYAIWTAQNLNIKEQHMTSAVVPNASCGLPLPRTTYFINEWNGFGWDRVELEEGDSVTVLAVDHNHWNEQYRIINGVFENVTEYLITNITNGVNEDINRIKDRLDSVEVLTSDHTTTLIDHQTAIENCIATEAALQQGLENEAIERKAKDDAHDAALENLRVTDENLLKGLENEAITRETTDNAILTRVDNLEVALENEATERKDVDSAHQAALENCAATEAALQQGLENEATIRENKDKEIDENIEYLRGKILIDGSNYDVETGVLHLKSQDGSNNIDITFSSNYGEC